MKQMQIENFFLLNKKPILYYKEYKSMTIIQLCDLLGIVIPRFCYHSKLSIAGNCRMCLVELRGMPKPVIACATLLLDKLEILTESKLINKLREDVLELLLINHPLDCPIRDQGGECDLQDQTRSFGSDRGRFKEMKRSVSDKELGPIIQTIMTRCIHCTRCIRFSEEHLGIFDLGILGRGSESEVKTIKVNFLNSELSGNLVDICPVGALTSKPLAFINRPWELKSIETIDCFDSFNSNIRVDVKGNKVFRILPRKNEHLNDYWISDLTRFSYEHLQMLRVYYPFISVGLEVSKSIFITHNVSDNMDTSYIKLDWAQTIEFLKLLKIKKNFNSINFFSGFNIGLLNISVFYHLTKYIKNSFFYLENLPYMYIDNRNSFYINRFNEFKNSNLFIFYDISLKENYSVFNSKFYNYLYKSSTTKYVMYVGKNTAQTYELLHIGNSINTFMNLLRGKNLMISNFYHLSKIKLNINLFSSDINFEKYLFELNIFDDVKINNFNFYSNAMGYFEMGINSSNNTAEDNSLSYYFKTSKINKSDYFSIYHGTHMPEVENGNLLFLPSYNNFEVSDSYINIYGDFQDSEQVLNVKDLGLIQSDFDIFKEILFIFFFTKVNINKLTTFNSFDLLFNELVYNYLYYYLINLNFKPYIKQLNFNSLVLKKNNTYFFHHKLSNLKIKDTFIVKYSDTLRSFYKKQEEYKSNFF